MAEEEAPLYPAAVCLPIFAGLAVILDIPPLVWHVRNCNIAAAALVAWIITFNSFAFINSLLWSREDASSWWPGYGLCDVEVYLIVAGWVGVTTTLVCIMRGLAKVLDTKNQVVTPCRAERIRQCLVDAAICWAPPILQLGLFDVIKVYRYYIYDINGCVPATDLSLVSFALVYLWPLVIGVVVVHYAVLVLVRLHCYRTEFSRLVHSHNTTRSRFLRLFLLSTLILLGILPTQAAILYANVPASFMNFSWSRNHDPIHRSTIQAAYSHGKLLPDRWVSLACGFLIFLFFGLGTDASDMYRSWAKKLDPARLFRRRNRNRRRSIFSISRSSTPLSPSARSTFSCKTYFTSSTATTRSNGTTGKSSSLSKSLCKSPLDFLRSSVDTAPASNGSRTCSTAPILPLHHNHHRDYRHSNNSSSNRNNSNVARTLSTASASVAAPTIDTAIPMTPLSKAIRKASVGTLVEDANDCDGATTVCGSPVVDVEKSGGGSGGESRRIVRGLGIEM
ncbi:a-factor receptor [Diplodia seriata]